MNSKSEDKIAVARHLLRKAFTPVSRTIKLANGRKPFDTLSNYICWYGFLHDNGTLIGVASIDLLDKEEIEQYRNIVKALDEGRAQFVRRYSYFFTRQDIFDEYQLVQTAHVALELGNKLSEEQVKDLYFVCCGVADLQELESVERVIQAMKVEYIVFREPDIGNQKTAIGVYPIEEHRRGFLKNYNILRFRNKMSELSAPVWGYEEDEEFA
jgi:hypothetical protein